ncbi:MAG TPA: HPr family phosphocarrier protein [Deltaproteobacteria bacterium]|nr:HPr family phosphocarrier protein [Deltaproteobacteria bacterium]
MIVEKELKIKNKLGLHARAAATLVKTANRFSSEIKLHKERLSANGKSIMGVLTLAAALGSTIKVTCEGEDAKEALEAIEQLIEMKFNEE